MIEGVLSNLRHLYHNMMTNVKDSAQAKRMAEGLLSPAIQKLENPDYIVIKKAAPEERSWHEDYQYENGCYYNNCIVCQRQFLGHKRRSVCKVCENDS